MGLSDSGGPAPALGYNRHFQITLGGRIAVKVIDIRGISVDAMVGPEHGATRIFVWCVSAGQGQVIGLHHHHGEELIRVLYGCLRFRLGD